MRKLFNKVTHNPQELVVGLCILMVAAAGAAQQGVASTALAIMFILSLFHIRNWRVSWGALEKTEKLVFAGFMLYTLTALLSWLNASDMDEFIKQSGRYIRFTLIIPVYLLIRAKNMDIRRYLLAGVVLSGFVYFGFALHSLYLKPGEPVAGHYHHITFGDGAMLSAGIMSVMILMPHKSAWLKIIIGVSLLGALYAAFMSQARGAWLALPLYLLVFIMYNSVSRKNTLLKLLLVSAVIGALVVLTPAGSIIEKRYHEAVTEAGQFISGENFDTSIGHRLAMWSIAYDVWREHPVIGTGLGDFDEDMVRYQAMGIYPEVVVYGSTHNIFVQALVGSGLVGFFGLCFGLVIAPLALFYHNKNADKPYATMGMLVIASYVLFGLSESWILRAPVISVYITYVISLSAISMNRKLAHKVERKMHG